MPDYDSFEDFVVRLREIEAMGYVETHRAGNTGIGKTLEDLLGIEENNVPSPDAAGVELKAARRHSESKMSLFTKEPPRGSRDKWGAASLVNDYGYYDEENDRLGLYCTLYVDRYNNQGFKLFPRDDGLYVEHEDDGYLAHYPPDVLRDQFSEKVGEIVLVEADSQTIDGTEHFHYNEAYHLDGFDADEFLRMIEEGVIKVELRMHYDEDGSGSRNHGTAFRILDTSELDRAYSNRTQLINGIGRDAGVTEDPQQGLDDF